MNGFNRWCERLIERTLDHFPIILVALTIFCFGGLTLAVFASYSSRNSPSILLSKGDWHCGKTDTFTTTQLIPQPNGQTMIMPVTETRCVQWNANR